MLKHQIESTRRFQNRVNNPKKILFSKKTKDSISDGLKGCFQYSMLSCHGRKIQEQQQLKNWTEFKKWKHPIAE